MTFVLQWLAFDDSLDPMVDLVGVSEVYLLGPRPEYPSQRSSYFSTLSSLALSFKGPRRVVIGSFSIKETTSCASQPEVRLLTWTGSISSNFPEAIFVINVPIRGVSCEFFLLWRRLLFEIVQSDLGEPFVKFRIVDGNPAVPSGVG